MKVRDSGMPDEELWSSFFSPAETLAALGLKPSTGDVVEFGCGYGTFTIPAAQMTTGRVYALDIDPKMIAATGEKARDVPNVLPLLRDFIADGTGLDDKSAEYAMLFNILHCEQPMTLLREAWRVLSRGGLLGIMHWNCDPTPPRGPIMSIRPRPEQCRDWAIAAGFRLCEPGIISLPPYHYGMVLERE